MILYKNKKLVIPTGINPNFHLDEGLINNQDKTVDISENGRTILQHDEGFTGLGTVTINTYVGQVKVEPLYTTEYTENGEFRILPDDGYDAIGELEITVDVQPELEAKIVDSSTNEQVVTTDKYGLSSVTVNPYTLDEKTVDSSTNPQVITSDEDGLKQVTINPYVLSPLEVDSSTASQEITGQFGTVTVNPYTLDSSSAVITENGDYVFESSADGLSRVDVSVNITTVNNQALTLDASINQQILTPSAPYTGFSPVTVNAVTAAIDSNIAAGNIKKDVSILGVTGTYEGGGNVTPGRPYIQANGTFGSQIMLEIPVPTTGYNEADVYIDCTFSAGTGSSYSAFSATAPMTTTKCIVGVGGYYNRQIAYGLGIGRQTAGAGAEQLYYLFGQPSTSTSYYNVGLNPGSNYVYHTNVLINDSDDNEAQVQLCTFVYNRFRGGSVAFSGNWFPCGNVQSNVGDWSVFCWEDDDDTYGAAPSGTRIYELHIRASNVIYDFYPVYVDGKAGLAKYTNGTFTKNVFSYTTSAVTYGVQV